MAAAAGRPAGGPAVTLHYYRAAAPAGPCPGAPARVRLLAAPSAPRDSLHRPPCCAGHGARRRADAGAAPGSIGCTGRAGSEEATARWSMPAHSPRTPILSGGSDPERLLSEPR